MCMLAFKCLSVSLLLFLSSCVLATASQDGTVRLWGPRSHLVSRKDSTSTTGEIFLYLHVSSHKKRDVFMDILEAVHILYVAFALFQRCMEGVM